MTVAPTTAIRMPGTRRWRLSRRITARVPAPTASAAALVLPASTAWANSQIRVSGPSPPEEKPNSLGNWLIITVIAMPFM